MRELVAEARPTSADRTATREFGQLPAEAHLEPERGRLDLLRSPELRLAVGSTLPEQVAAYLRNAIFSGALSPGDRVDPDALSQDLGVSRQPVREALIALAAEGLVERPPRRHTIVAELHREDILDHFASYGLLTGLAAERAASTLSEAELAALTDLVAKMDTTASPTVQAQLNLVFHTTINRAGASKRLKALLRLLNRSIPSLFFEMTPHWSEMADKQHHTILAALQERDGPRARQESAEHLLTAGNFAVRLLEEAGFWPPGN
jgi:DNA-binding GntR family transcriptional regulator